jgi:hypothetical protein
MNPRAAGWTAAFVLVLVFWGVTLGLTIVTFIPGVGGVTGISWRKLRGMVNNPGIHRDNLYTVDNAMQAAGVPYWLGEGTALGAVREGDIIKGDSDVDIGVSAEDESKFKQDVVPTLQRQGFKIGRTRPFTLVRGDERGEAYVDVDFTGRGLPCMAVKWPSSCDPIVDALRPFGRAQIGDRDFTVPSTRYLSLLYGDDWMVPKDNFKPKHVKR